MARNGINRALVQRARDTLLSRGQHPSIDAVRVELGNTGSKTTIARYLKEIDAVIFGSSDSPDTLTDELSALILRVRDRLLEESHAALARERLQFNEARNRAQDEISTLQFQRDESQKKIDSLQSALKVQEEKLQTTQSSLQTELRRNARISQTCSDFEIRVQEKDAQIQSLEEKHTHAREALEHYRVAVKEQRDQDLSRHESQIYQMKQEVAVLQQTLMVKQEDASRMIRDNERLIAENRQHTKEANQHRDAIEHLKGDLGIANAATARAEGAKELLSQQLEAKAKEASDALSQAAAGQLREAELMQKLANVEADLEKMGDGS